MIDHAIDIHKARKQLALLLRTFRTTSGITGRHLGELTAMSQSKISKMERGQLQPSLSDVQAIITALKIDETSAVELLAITKRIIEWDATYKSSDPEDQQIALMKLEKVASDIRGNCTLAINGLLQTSAYAHYGYRNWWCPHLSEEEIDRRVVRRLQRSALIADRSKTFRFVIAQSVLNDLSTLKDLAIGQLNHLIECASLNNVSIAIMPSVATAVVPARHIHFHLIDNFASIESIRGARFMEDQYEIDSYSDCFERLWELSTKEDKAIEILRQHRKKAENNEGSSEFQSAQNTFGNSNG